MVVSFLKNTILMLNNKEMLTDLKGIIKPYIQNQEAFDNLNEETDFINDLKVNSANLVDIVLDVEDKFDIEIDNDSMDRMLNVKAALSVIQEKLNGKEQ